MSLNYSSIRENVLNYCISQHLLYVDLSGLEPIRTWVIYWSKFECSHHHNCHSCKRYSHFWFFRSSSMFFSQLQPILHFGPQGLRNHRHTRALICVNTIMLQAFLTFSALQFTSIVTPDQAHSLEEGFQQIHEAKWSRQNPYFKKSRF